MARTGQVVESGVESLREELQEKTLLSCHEVLNKKLDVKEIYSQMNQKNLLTTEDRHVLQDANRSQETKVNYIIEILPRKQSGWWGKFITCLKASTSGTAHEYLASILMSQLRQKMHECGLSAHSSEPVPSGVSLDMYALIESDVVAQPTGYSEQDNEKSPDIAEQRPDLADILIPIVELKDKLDAIKYNYKIIKNQVALLQAFDELIEKTKSFRDALSNLLILYIDKFKAKKLYNYSQLTEMELNVIKIIEQITESTEDIDIDKEREVWSQCIKKMEKSRDDIKEALYSQDISKMAKVQKTWKLDGENRKIAEDWIRVRKGIIALGNDFVDELNKMCGQDDALVASIYDAVYTRVKVGEVCLNACIKWFEERIKLGSSTSYIAS